MVKMSHGKSFKVPRHIKNKMHKLAKLALKSGELDNEISEYFIALGFNEESLRSGSGNSLEELLYGNDITDIFCENIERSIDEGQFGSNF